MRFILKAAALTTALCSVAGFFPVQAAENLSSLEMLHFLVQSVRTDSAGRAIKGLPEPGVATRFQHGSDPVFYRKHDWADSQNHPATATGYQVSDSVLDHKGKLWLMVQTFDFGDGERKFGVFDGKGDGGQVVTIVDGIASAFMTEDGGDGIQWFIGPGGISQSSGDRKFVSWILFAYNVSADHWTEVVARLSKTRQASEHPRAFGAAYTRYRMVKLDVPFRTTDEAGKPIEFSRQMPVIISEHYGGTSIAGANHLERFYFGRDFGLIRWERWENKTFSKQADIDKTAEAFAVSGRVPPIAYSTAPGTSWRMVDSRTWTNIVSIDGTWKVDDYQWPEKTVLDQL